jgi:hypothetical protein
MPAVSRAKIGRTGDRAEQEAERTSQRALNGQSQDSRAATRAPEPTTDRELFPHPGKPLEPAARNWMESRFHFDFSQVRIHNDESAARTAAGISARAFTLGGDIAFGQGQYEPQTSTGRRLLAHELAHVVQSGQDSSPVIRRDPKLKGSTHFGESDSGDIDKVIAASGVTKYVPTKSLKTLAANVDEESPVVFAEQYKKYGQSEDDVDSVPGFVNRAEQKPIKLRAPGNNDKGKPVEPSNFEDAVHETVHLNSQTKFQASFGHAFNEGVTEYFTEMVLGEPGKAYRDQVDAANGLIAVVGEKLVGEAYFLGKPDLFNLVMQAFGTQNRARDLREWQKKIQSKDPADWKLANSLLANALKKRNTAAPAVPVTTAPPSTAPTKSDPSKS